MSDEFSDDLKSVFSVHLYPIESSGSAESARVQVEFSIRAGHMFSGSTLPTKRDPSTGFWRRFLTGFEGVRPPRRTRQFGKRRHRRGWCAL